MNLIRFEDWNPGAKHPGKYNMRLPVGLAYIHHTVTPRPISQVAEVEQLRDIDADHRGNGWDGIGYNFIVGPSGTVYEGRGQRIGAHNDGENSTSLGLCFLGTFTDTIPTPAAMQAMAELIRHLIAVGALTPDFRMRGHRDSDATACPGNSLYRDLPVLYRLATGQRTPEPEETPVSDRIRVNAPCVGAIASYDEDGNIKGYALIGADYGVFCFGEGATFLGNVDFVPPADDSWTPDA